MKTIGRVSVLLLLGFLWFCFLCNQVMSRYGIYEIFSYRTNELLSLVPFLGLGLTSLWAVLVLVQGLRKKEWRSCVPLLAILLLFSVLQFVQVHQLIQVTSVTTHITIEAIDSKTLTLQAQTSDGPQITLTYPMLVGALLKTDGTSYYVSYETSGDSASHGVLTMIWDTQEPY